MVRSCGTANSSTPARLSLLAILAETATVRRDATHDVTSAVWTRSAPKIDLGSPGILRCATGDENGDVLREPDADHLGRSKSIELESD